MAVISRVGGSPTTSHAEDLRQTDLSVIGMPGPHEFTKQDLGIVDEVHPDLPRLVKAHTSDGAVIANGNWIELNHSASEITEKWGTIRVGFTLRVTTVGGQTGLSANATIIGTEGKDINEPPIENSVDRSLYLLYAPGSGI